MNAWWQTLSSRERIVLISAASVITLVVFFLGIWEPLTKKVNILRQTVAEERKQAAWMEQAALEVRARQGKDAKKKSTGESLLTVIDRSARKAGMGANLNRIEPEGKDKVRLWLNNISFETIISWLVELNQFERIISESVVADRQSTPGRINARLVLMAESN